MAGHPLRPGPTRPRTASGGSHSAAPAPSAIDWSITVRRGPSLAVSPAPGVVRHPFDRSVLQGPWAGSGDELQSQPQVQGVDQISAEQDHRRLAQCAVRLVQAWTERSVLAWTAAAGRSGWNPKRPLDASSTTCGLPLLWQSAVARHTSAPVVVPGRGDDQVQADIRVVAERPSHHMRRPEWTRSRPNRQRSKTTDILVDGNLDKTAVVASRRRRHAAARLPATTDPGVDRFEFSEAG